MLRALILFSMSWFAISGEATQVTCQKDSGALKVLHISKLNQDVIVEFGAPRSEESYSTQATLLSEVASSINTEGERARTFMVDESLHDMLGVAQKLDVVSGRERYVEVKFFALDRRQVIERFSADECAGFNSLLK
jgi:hypothetical protein